MLVQEALDIITKTIKEVEWRFESMYDSTVDKLIDEVFRKIVLDKPTK